jgi:hypothetical protein
LDKWENGEVKLDWGKSQEKKCRKSEIWDKIALLGGGYERMNNWLILGTIWMEEIRELPKINWSEYLGRYWRTKKGCQN